MVAGNVAVADVVVGEVGSLSGELLAIAGVQAEPCGPVFVMVEVAGECAELFTPEFDGAGDGSPV